VGSDEGTQVNKAQQGEPETKKTEKRAVRLVFIHDVTMLKCSYMKVSLFLQATKALRESKRTALLCLRPRH
jgi:hypothetical protein